jgi:hypothetical protein
MYLRAQGEIHHLLSDAEPLPELKDSLVDAIGQPIRRISRFIQLALIGAGRCARAAAAMPSNTAVYFASSRGDLEITVDVLNTVFREGHSPKPLSFVNTVSNSAAFYIAKCLKLDARSSFACSRYFAFENALQLAMLDMQMGITSSALIGSVDSIVLPLAAHRERLELESSAAVAEGSHWFWFTRDAGASQGARVMDVFSARDRDQLIEWLSGIKTSKVAFAAGQYLPEADAQDLRTAAGFERSLSYLSAGHYPSQSATMISALTNASDLQSVVHVNRDSLGRYMGVLLSK